MASYRRRSRRPLRCAPSYLSGRGNFYSSPFMVNRFVLMSSKESVGGGPYVTEEVFPLYEGGSSFGLPAMEAHPR